VQQVSSRTPSVYWNLVVASATNELSASRCAAEPSAQ